MGSKTPEHFKLVPLSDDVRLEAFDLKFEDQELNDFLLGDCRHHHNDGFSKTYVYVDMRDEVPRLARSYITVVVSQLAQQLAAKAFADIADLAAYPSPYPALKIARLATCQKSSGMHLGVNLVEYVIALARLEIAPRVGCRLVVVDANKPAVGFYTDRGFKLLNSQKNLERTNPIMYVDLFTHIDPAA